LRATIGELRVRVSPGHFKIACTPAVFDPHVAADGPAQFASPCANALMYSSPLGSLSTMLTSTPMRRTVAEGRFDARRDAVVNEANAIGTTALRARLLPVPHDVEINKLLQK
jgi:hypothetical protein